MKVLEILSVLSNVAFLILLMRNNIACWFFGILASLLALALFSLSKLYAESALMVYYVAIGVYGWWNWAKNGNGENSNGIPVTEKNRSFHFFWIAGLALSTLFSGVLLDRFTDAAMPVVDSATTLFGLFAAWLQAKKVLSSWLYWVVINGVSVWLYLSRDLEIYALLMIFYTVMSVVGFYNWYRMRAASL